jgi:hypothetical protein
MTELDIIVDNGLEANSPNYKYIPKSFFDKDMDKISDFLDKAE